MLLHLDALGDDPIDLRLDVREADLAAVLTLVDAVGAVRAAVRAVVVGELVGAAVALLAAADERRVFPHARIVLQDPTLAAKTADAESLAADVRRQQSMLASVWDVVAGATGRTRAEIEADARAGRFLTADEAVAYGLATEVVAPAR